MRHTLATLMLGTGAMLAGCAPPPPPSPLAVTPLPPRIVEVLPPAQPLAGVTLRDQGSDQGGAPRPANPSAAFNGGGAVLEHRDGATRQVQ